MTKLTGKNTRDIATVRKELDTADLRLQAIWAEYDKGQNRFLPPIGPDNPKLDAAFDEAFAYRSRLICELAALEAAPHQARFI